MRPGALVYPRRACASTPLFLNGRERTEWQCGIQLDALRLAEWVFWWTMLPRQVGCFSDVETQREAGGKNLAVSVRMVQAMINTAAAGRLSDAGGFAGMQIDGHEVCSEVASRG